MRLLLSGFVGLSSGMTIGSAAAAFFTLLNFIARMIQIVNAKKIARLYHWTIALGSTISSLIYFFNITLKLYKIFSVFISLIMGIFVGMFSSALAEVLNVMPVLSKKFKAKHHLKFITTSFLLGKTIGSLWYWLVYLKR